MLVLAASMAGLGLALFWIAYLLMALEGPGEQCNDAHAPLAADLAYRAIFNIGQPQVIGPLIGADRDRVATAVVGAIDQQKPRTRMSRISPNGIFCGRSIIWANRPLPTASSLATSGS